MGTLQGLNKKDVLFLTVAAKPFEVMVTLEKNEEFRTFSDWIIRRLKKPVRFIRFVNGYGKDRPYFICRFNGHELTREDIVKTYSNGLSVTIPRSSIVIHLGEIFEVGNLDKMKKSTTPCQRKNQQPKKSTPRSVSFQ